jgi:ABC-type uncharacterized transport system auxiliary subunit
MWIPLLGGCLDVLNQTPASPMVTLRDMEPQQLCQEALKEQILIGYPEAEAGLATDRIALLFEEREIKYLANAKWAKNCPMIIQRKLEQYLNASGCFISAGPETSGMTGNFRLLTNLQRMHLCYSSALESPVARLRLQLSLLEIRSGSVISSTYIHRECPTKNSDTGSLLDAMDTVVHLGMQDASLWVAQTMRARLQENSSPRR